MNTRISLSTLDKFRTIGVMAEGHPNATVFLMNFIKEDEPMTFVDVITLDRHSIYGENLFAMWHDCCHEDADKFHESLEAIRAGRFSSKEIMDKISRKESFI